MTEKSTINSKETLSPVVYEQLKEVLGEKYDYASTVVTYAEVQSLEFNYTGMAEFRDALTHVKRAIYLDDIAEAQDELNSASEHIRRAAVESMQEYIESRYINFRRGLYFPNKYWFKFNHNEISDLEHKLKSYLFLGREAKPSKKWLEAIGYFKKSEEVLDQLEKKISPLNQRLKIVSFLFYIILALLTGFLLGSSKL